MTLIRIKPLDPPVRELGWLVVGDNCTALQYAIVERAMKDIGIREKPLGSNRGVRIDRYAKSVGSPLGSWWCAIWVARVYADVGVLVPRAPGLTDNWLPYIDRIESGAKPQVGDAILYGIHKKGPVVPWGDSHHIGIVVDPPDRDQPLLLTIEGNRGYAGTTNNGVAVDIGPANRTDILGYFRPRLTE